MPYFRTDRRNKLYYELHQNAEASETLVFLHGWAEYHKIWREQIDFFKKKYQVLVYDLRGFGLSSKPTYGYSLKRQSKYLRNLLQNLEISNYWLIGHSLGGMITLKYSERFFDEIKGVVLIDTTAYIPTKFSIWRNLGSFFVSKTLRQIWQKTLKSSKSEPRRTLIENLIHDSDSVPLYVSAACGIAVLNSAVNLKQISCPVLIIVGEKDILTPVDMSKKMHKKLSNSELEIIADTGHMSFLEKPSEINSKMAIFFQSSH